MDIEDDLESHSSEDVLILEDTSVDSQPTHFPETSPCARLCVTSVIFTLLFGIFILAAVWPYRTQSHSL